MAWIWECREYTPSGHRTCSGRSRKPTTKRKAEVGALSHHFGKGHRVVVTEMKKRYQPRSKKKRACASDLVAAMTKEWKKGRWKSRQQAIAVGLSKARKEC